MRKMLISKMPEMLVFLTAFFGMQAALAQGLFLAAPRASQYASVTQRIGLTDITINYHRPGVKEREVWGTLVPYNEVWRAGANENTTISFTHDVAVNGKKLPAGTYGLHMIPSEGDWTVIFSKNHTSWGSFFYDEAEDAARVAATPVKTTENQDWLEYRFEDVTQNSAVAQLRWEKLVIPFKIEVDVNAIVLRSIRNELRGLDAFAWQPWMEAANYCLQNNTSLDEGIQWIDHSIGMNQNVNNMGVKAQLLLKKGDTAGAESTMAEALAFAKQTGRENDMNAVGYMYLQSNRVKEAIEVFKLNVKKYPDSWNVYDSLGEAQAQAGDKKSAIANYQAALSKAPDNQKGRIQGILKELQKN